MVSLVNISQALGNPSHQMTIFFRLSQTIIMESFNRGEHLLAAFLDVEKAFDNVWHSGLRYKIYQFDLPTKLCRWLSDFLVGRVIQVKIEGFLSPKVYPKVGVPQGSNLSEEQRQKEVYRSRIDKTFKMIDKNPLVGARTLGNGKRISFENKVAPIRTRLASPPAYAICSDYDLQRHHLDVSCG